MLSPLVLRITAPLVVVSLLLLGVGVGAAWYVHHMQAQCLQGLLVNVSSMRAAEEVEILIREIRTQFDHFLMTGDRSHLQASPAFRKETEHWLSVAERYSISSSEKEQTSRARRGYVQFLESLNTLPGSLPRGELEIRVRKLIDEVIVQEILQPIHTYLDDNEVEVEQSVAENQQLADRLVYGLLSLGICGCGAGLAAGFGIARGVSQSLIQLSVPIRAAAGQLETLVGPFTFTVGTDIHELEGLLHLIAERIGSVIERLRQSEREVLRSEQLAGLGQMAAGMAHELRNPLTSMKLLVQAALADGSSESLFQNPSPGPSPERGGEKSPVTEAPPRVGEGLGRGFGIDSDLSQPEVGQTPSGCLGDRDLRILEEEICRMEVLLQSFLQFARPPKLERREVNLNRLVEQAVRLVSARAGQHRQIRIECQLPDAPLLFPLDSGQFSQVLLNLLLNALDAVPAEGLIRVAVFQESGGSLRLEVSDTGRGLPDELGERIFAPFVTNKETGLGLGLSICKRIVEAHGGWIGGANRPEGGAIFTVNLPPASVSDTSA